MASTKTLTMNTSMILASLVIIASLIYIATIANPFTTHAKLLKTQHGWEVQAGFLSNEAARLRPAEHVWVKTLKHPSEKLAGKIVHIDSLHQSLARTDTFNWLQHLGRQTVIIQLAKNSIHQTLKAGERVGVFAQ